MPHDLSNFVFFFFNDPAPTEISPLPLHDALPIFAALLPNLQPRDILFIDEIHRLAPPVEEILYPAMEDFQLDLIIGEGPGARSIRIDLPPFTLDRKSTRLNSSH